MGSYTHVDQAAKARALRLIRGGEITIAEAARLVGVSVAAAGAWMRGFNKRAARWKKVEQIWKEAKSQERA